MFAEEYSIVMETVWPTPTWMGCVTNWRLWDARTMACNFDPAATDSDDSCTYPEPNLDCNGDCMNDVNDNGICDELELADDDDTACNFNADAVLDDGSCDYAATYYNCDGDCENDADGDGVCDELKEGCMQLEACNLTPTPHMGTTVVCCQATNATTNDATVNDT